jgi:hypothetical protein
MEQRKQEQSSREIDAVALCRGPFYVAGVLTIIVLHIAAVGWALSQLQAGHELVVAAAPPVVAIALFWVVFVVLSGLQGREEVTNWLGIGFAVAFWLALPLLAIWWIVQRFLL